MQDLTPGFEAMPDSSRSEEDRAAARRARAPLKKKPHQLSLVGFCF
jgi:dienelactone hydrolase